MKMETWRHGIKIVGNFWRIYIHRHTSLYCVHPLRIFMYFLIKFFSVIFPLLLYECLNIHIYIYICWRFMKINKTEKASPGDFPEYVYPLLIVKTEVCLLSICWQTKRTCPSLGRGQGEREAGRLCTLDYLEQTGLCASSKCMQWNFARSPRGCM